MFKIVELRQPNDFKFKYPFVVYKRIKNKYGKPIYSAIKQFRREEQAKEYIGKILLSKEQGRV